MTRIRDWINLAAAMRLAEASEDALLLYHGTSPLKARRIIDSGPRTGGARNGTFGKAFYCSTRPEGTRFYDKGAILVFRFKPAADVLSLNEYQRNGKGTADAVISHEYPPYGDREVAVFNTDAVTFVGWYNKVTGGVDQTEPTYPSGFYHSWNR